MTDALADVPETFTTEEALTWLHSVDGELYRTPPSGRARRAWIAVVRTPDFGTQRAKLILALGNTALDAVTAAASQWRAVWNGVPRAD